MKLQRTLIILLVPILLVLGSVRLLATDRYLAFEYGKTSFPDDPYGFDRRQRMDIASSALRFVRENKPIEFLADQKLGNDPLYNSRELKHMADVQDVYQTAWRIWLLSFWLFAFIVIGHARSRKAWPGLRKAIFKGGLLTASVIAGLGLLAVVAWQAWFVAFHQVFFAAGSWTFATSDTLIRLFPEKFWFDAALTISGLTFSGGMILALSMRNWRGTQPLTNPAQSFPAS